MMRPHDGECERSGYAAITVATRFHIDGASANPLSNALADVLAPSTGQAFAVVR